MPTYRERQPLPFSWALGTLVVAGLAAAEIHDGAHGWRAVVPYAVLLPLTLAAVAWASRHEVRVQDGVLHVPSARAPVSAFGPPEVLQRDELRQWLGPAARADAWVAVRPWHRTAVRLPVVDPADDTPYWVVGTKHPLALVEALT